MREIESHSLMFAGVGAILGAALHVVALIGGPEWIAFLRAPAAVVESARQGTWLAPVGCLFIAGLMTGCGLYAFSGAGVIGRLPFLRAGLVSIAAVCLLRGMILLPFLLYRPELFDKLPVFDVVASLVWFMIGAAYAIGAWQIWYRTERIFVFEPERPTTFGYNTHFKTRLFK
ncbi:hypothetical protein [Parachitinimonas caeni]|uniref:Uncharacterized protein n=1 Tax=Parachitinimonas caeni TaxID=3031301 RepID=A0ABT7E484_9NEIS|nr:hypothetical protein [Parachitinimonas caeni]MDK2126158.1 hypothetical protein [Parachitinimonas caeni]